jgi:hypothetical protein
MVRPIITSGRAWNLTRRSPSFGHCCRLDAYDVLHAEQYASSALDS